MKKFFLETVACPFCPNRDLAQNELRAENDPSVLMSKSMRYISGSAALVRQSKQIPFSVMEKNSASAVRMTEGVHRLM